MPDKESLPALATLLRQRIEVIADHRFRARDPDAHLEALKTVSEQIASTHDGLRGQLPARLEHFMTGCSYDKALAFIETMPTD